MPKGKLFRPGGLAEVADDPVALDAAGLCGSPNKRQPGTDSDVSPDKPAKYKYCHRAKLKGKARCKRHGGENPAGPAAAAWAKAPVAAGHVRDRPSKSPAGKYSGILGGSYAEAYAQSLGELNLTDLREQIALCDARERRLVEVVEARRLERGETGLAWKRARNLYERARRAGRVKDVAGFNSAMDELGTVVTRGADEQAAWDELRENMLTRRRLVQVQRQLVAVNGDYMSRPELKAIAAQLIDLFRELLTDRQQLDQARERVEMIMTQAARVAADISDVN